MEIMIRKPPDGHIRVVNVRRYLRTDRELREYVEKTYRGYVYEGVYEGLPFNKRIDNPRYGR